VNLGSLINAALNFVATPRADELMTDPAAYHAIGNGQVLYWRASMRGVGSP
jgi:hypothetical protein